MSSTPSITDRTTWALDREIVLVRVLAATRELGLQTMQSSLTTSGWPESHADEISPRGRQPI